MIGYDTGYGGNITKDRGCGTDKLPYFRVPADQRPFCHGGYQLGVAQRQKDGRDPDQTDNEQAQSAETKCFNEDVDKDACKRGYVSASKTGTSEEEARKTCDKEDNKRDKESCLQGVTWGLGDISLIGVPAVFLPLSYAELVASVAERSVDLLVP